MLDILNKLNLDEAHDIAKERQTSQFNCWGATLYTLDKIDSLEWVYKASMNKFLKEETHIVKTPKKGDIFVMYEEIEGLTHTAVYVGKDLLWHKIGARESRFATEEEIKNVYYDYDKIEIRRLNQNNRKEITQCQNTTFNLQIN